MNTTVYQEAAVVTQSKGRVIVMLYEGAVKFLKQAKIAIENGNIMDKGRLICRAQDIIFELNTVLDMETGGQIAVNLRKLYNFMWRSLGQANASNDTRMITDIIGLLEELNSGWKTIAQ